MEDDDEPQSPSQSPRSQSPSPPASPPLAVPVSSPHPNGSGAVTVAAPPHHTLTLALPIQHPTRPLLPPSSNPSSSSNRDDCWSEGATSALIDAWGERFLELSRGNLKQKHWQDVADAVSSRDDYTKAPRTDVQCKNRIDTLKKKYKTEKSKSSFPSYSSPWPFFHRLDLLLAPSNKPTPNPNPPPIRSALNLPQFHQKPRSAAAHAHHTSKKRKLSPQPRASPPVSASSSDSLPPETANGGSRRQKREEGVRELTKAIEKFGEVYERVERSKLEMTAEMEKQRMGFAEELELQRLQFFMRTQMELSQLKKQHRRRRVSTSAVGGGSGSNVNNTRHHHHHHHHRLHQHQNNSSNSNTSNENNSG